MPQFFIAVLRPSSDDSPKADAAMHADIDALNDEMQAAGARKFAGGLGKPEAGRTVRLAQTGDIDRSHPQGLPSLESLDGFWIIEAPEISEAVEWGRKAAGACRAVIEVRQFL